MLQQGTYVADVAYFIGEDTPKMTGVCDPELPRGYSFDYINAEVLLTKSSVKGNKLTLESGMQYRVLVLPKQKEYATGIAETNKEVCKRRACCIRPHPGIFSEVWSIILPRTGKFRKWLPNFGPTHHTERERSFRRSIR